MTSTVRWVVATVVLAGVAVAAVILFLPHGKPDVKACKAAMTRQFTDALRTGAQGHRPDACKGVSDRDLNRIVSQILGGG